MSMFCTGNPDRKTTVALALKPDQSASNWIIDQPFRIPIIQLESVK